MAFLLFTSRDQGGSDSIWTSKIIMIKPHTRIILTNSDVKLTVKVSPAALTGVQTTCAVHVPPMIFSSTFYAFGCCTVALLFTSSFSWSHDAVCSLLGGVIILIKSLSVCCIIAFKSCIICFRMSKKNTWFENGPLTLKKKEFKYKPQSFHFSRPEKSEFCCFVWRIC